MVRRTLRHALLSLCAACLVSSGCNEPTSAPTASTRAWVTEAELAADAGLYAGHGTVVVLDLEPGSASQRNTLRYVLQKSGMYRVCLDEDDELIATAVLLDGKGSTVASLDRSTPCQSVQLSPGPHTFHVHHDGTAVGTDRRHAFVHSARRTPPASTTAMLGDTALTTSASNPLPPTRGDRWLAEGQALLGADLSSGKPQWMVPWLDPAFKIRFATMSGLGFGCAAKNEAMRSCCLLKGAPQPDIVWNSSGGSVTYPLYDVFLAQGADCGSSSALRYELVDKGDYRFLINLFDAAGKRYHLTDEYYGHPNHLQIYETADATFPFDYGYLLTPDSRINYMAVELPAEQVDAAVLASLVQSQLVLYPGPGCTGTAMILNPQPWFLRDPSSWTQSDWDVPMDVISSVRVAHDTQWFRPAGWVFPFRDGPPTVCRDLDSPTTVGWINGQTLYSQYVESRPTLPILVSTKNCRNCDLAGVNLAKTKLDGIDFTSAFLGWADLGDASLKRALLSNAVLSGATLDHANLAGANLCGTFLNGTIESHGAASLVGAYLKNVHLGGANLSGALMTNVNFYTDATSTCTATPCDGKTPWPAQCATAAGATMTSARINDAYLTGVDFSGVHAQGVDFSSSVLVGASFRGATFGADPTTSVPASFTQALLQGANFGNAVATGTSFDSAYVDLTGDSHALGFTIKGPHDDFVGFWIDPRPAGGICVAYGYTAATIPPGVDGTTTCPSGRKYGAVHCADGSILDQHGKCAGGVDPVKDDCWSGPPRVPIEQSLMSAQFDSCDPFKADPTW